MRKQRGFTLIELLVVVSILAAMATISVSVVGGYDQKARAELVEVEMKTIANAIYRFHRDTGYFPKTGLFDNSGTNGFIYESYETFEPASSLDWLFSQPVKCRRANSNTDPNLDSCFINSEGNKEFETILPWDNSTARGWNGPYLTHDSQQRLAIKNCDLSPDRPVTRSSSLSSSSVIAIEDPFLKQIDFNSAPHCFIRHSEKVDTSDPSDLLWDGVDYSGQPYFYSSDFENNAYPECSEDGTPNNGCIVLLSAGPNGIPESGNNDDIVKILRAK